MTRYVLDTDILSRYRGRKDVALTERIRSTPQEQIAVSVISVEEAIGGWFTYLRQAKTPSMVAYGYSQFAETVSVFANLPLVGYSEEAQVRYKQLKATVRNVGGNDLRIAAIALEMGATVVTRNLRDFERVPDLPVENWASDTGD